VQTEGTISSDYASTQRLAYKQHLEECLKAVDTFKPQASMLQNQWSGIVWPASEDAIHDPPTGVEGEVLTKVGQASVAVPNDFVSYLLDSSVREFLECSILVFVA